MKIRHIHLTADNLSWISDTQQRENMKQELQDKIYAAGPLLYTQKSLGMRETAMCWGFGCGKGWFNLLMELTKKIEPLLEAYQRDFPDEEVPAAVQVKEKFGTLRFYMSYETEEMSDLINQAERQSATTCENCGSLEGKLQGTGWVKTLCDECSKERDKKNKVTV